MKTPSFVRYCKLRIAAISNRKAEKAQARSSIPQAREPVPSNASAPDEREPAVVERSNRRYPRLLRRLRKHAPKRKKTGFQQFQEDEIVFDSDEEDDFFVTSFDWVGTEAITVMTQNSVQEDEEQVLPKGVSPADDIWTACKIGDLLFVETTIDTEPAMIHQEKDGRSPLYLACLCGKTMIVKALLEAGAKDLDRTAFIAALNKPCRDLLRVHKFGQKDGTEEIKRGKKKKNKAARLLAPVFEEHERTAAEEDDVVQPVSSNASMGKHGVLLLGNGQHPVIPHSIGECISLPDDPPQDDVPFDEPASEVTPPPPTNSNSAAIKTVKSDEDPEADDESKTSIFNEHLVVVPFKSHLVHSEYEGFETILQPLNEQGADNTTYNPNIVADVSSSLVANEETEQSVYLVLDEGSKMKSSKIDKLNSMFLRADKKSSARGKQSSDDNDSVTDETVATADDAASRWEDVSVESFDDEDDFGGKEFPLLTFEDLKDEVYFTMFGCRRVREEPIPESIPESSPGAFGMQLGW